ncbi:MAG: hypothetical protein P4L40_06515 [Terracidiphilus sp.]|nr:hypothetical protein [Terracidiphilus sp.]
MCVCEREGVSIHLSLSVCLFDCLSLSLCLLTVCVTERIDYGNIVGYDKTASPAVWKSVTQAAFVAPTEAAPTEFSTTFKTLSHPTSDTLDAYSKRWCVCVCVCVCVFV